jgi:hypothetical protein
MVGAASVRTIRIPPTGRCMALRLVDIRCITSQKVGLKRLRRPRPREREVRNETSNFRITRPSGQKPDALALMGCSGGWIVMPVATKLSVSMIVSISAFLPHCKLSDLTDSLSALSI